MFEAFYSSFWQHPVLLILLPILFLIGFGRKLFQSNPGFLRNYLALVLAGTLLDALLTSDSIVRALGISPGLASIIAIFFVVAGDFRVFLLSIRESRPKMSVAVWASAVALSLMVPLIQAGLIAAFPRTFAEVRLTFLVYEVLLFGVLAGSVQRLGLVPSAALGREILLYALVTYGLWIVADIVILSGFDLGYLLRVIPNLLYYGAYAPFVYFRAKAHGFLQSSFPRVRSAS